MVAQVGGGVKQKPSSIGLGSRIIQAIHQASGKWGAGGEQGRVGMSGSGGHFAKRSFSLLFVAIV